MSSGGEALGAIGNPEVLEILKQYSTDPVIEAAPPQVPSCPDGAPSPQLSPAGLRCGSALFRHEIGYVLGQLQHEAAVPQLVAALARPTENPMVRHECAEALGAIARPACLAALRAHAADPERVVRESCEVALDMYEYETGSAFQYADGLEHLRPPPS
ncbi:Deoxyhypusine hydroxylase, partial [Eschrichtius robustus]|nr:Deoxyhypusine hydroxylase [Eschrichtius robustus]